MSEDIESTLVFDTDDRYDYDDDRRLVAEGIHERGPRAVWKVYILEDETRLLIRSYYHFAGGRRNQSSASEWTVSDGTVEYNDQPLEDFIRDNFHADPEAVLGAEYDSMVPTEDGGRV